MYHTFTTFFTCLPPHTPFPHSNHTSLCMRVGCVWVDFLTQTVCLWPCLCSQLTECPFCFALTVCFDSVLSSRLYGLLLRNVNVCTLCIGGKYSKIDGEVCLSCFVVTYRYKLITLYAGLTLFVCFVSLFSHWLAASSCLCSYTIFWLVVIVYFFSLSYSRKYFSFSFW